MVRFNNEGLDHVAIGVTDVERSRRFYGETLGSTPTAAWRPRLSPAWARRSGGMTFSGPRTRRGGAERPVAAAAGP